jgi:subtilisin family serine protease
VVDTGTGPHPHLDHAGTAGAFIDGRHDPSPPAGHDVDMHGTHVSGTIGARPPDGSDQLVGVAPGVDLVGARFFPPPTTAPTRATSRPPSRTFRGSVALT